MFQSQLNFFAQVDSKKKTQVFDALQKSGSDLRIKIRDQNYKSKILDKKDDGHFAIYKFIPGNFQEQEAIFSFDALDSKYFFRGTIATIGSDLMMPVPEELFQLVRRNDFRIDLPPKNAYPCSVVSLGGKKKSVLAELRNISLGGCQVWIVTSDLTVNKNDEISLGLTIKDFEWDSIKGIAKQIRPANEKGDMTVIGIQFKDPGAEFLTEVQSALMYLDRVHRQRHDKV